jgi:hypothetical protein
VEQALNGYTGAIWKAASSSNYSSGRSGYSVKYVVIHDVEGSYSGAISWFQNSAAQASAHYVIRSSDGQITQMVDESNTAWHDGKTLHTIANNAATAPTPSVSVRITAAVNTGVRPSDLSACRSAFGIVDWGRRRYSS